MRALPWLLAIPLGLLAVVAVLAVTLQRRLLYFPERTSEERALARAKAIGLAPWRDRRGALRGWQAAPASPPRARVLVFHGNAGSALDRASYAAALVPRGLSVAVLEYPGYGARAGSPSEASITAAALEAVDALAEDGSEPLWLLGESLGSGVAARVARLRPARVRGVVLVTPFARLAEVARIHYPFLPDLLIRERWAPLDDLPGWRGPVALLLAGRDEVVSVEQGRRLAAALPGPTRVWEQPDATHNTLDLRPGSGTWDEVIGFVGGLPAPPL